jgi:UPF0176 protein
VEQPIKTLSTKRKIMFNIATFYHFFPVDDVPAARAWVTAQARTAGAVGTFLIAPEGVNTTLAGQGAEFTALVDTLVARFSVPGGRVKWSAATVQPFARLKVRAKREVITLKRPGVDAAAQTGVYVSPDQWNALISRPDVMVIDTRNAYETQVGTFQGAVMPTVRHFSDFADYVDSLDPATTPPVAMFCTGGIRCEKASSYMLKRGFKNVYQLDGGIIKYLEVIPENDSLWQGNCFVFDERGAVGQGVVEK